MNGTDPKKAALLPWLVLALVLCAIGAFFGYSLYQDHARIGTYERQCQEAQAKAIEKNHVLPSALFADWRRDALKKAAQFGALTLAVTAALYLYQRRQRKFEHVSARYLAELVEAKETAQRTNEAKSRLLATVAHEFRTPLSLLTSSTDILDRYGERLSREEHAQQHEHIRNAARQMTSLVASVLAFNNLDTPYLQNHPAPLDVARFCRNLANEVKTAFSTGQTLRVTIADNCGTVLLDEVLLRRVVENLLTNAFRYTPADGAVSFHVSRENNTLRVVVMDSGIGIPKECHQQIFEAFFRCENVDVRRGLGLGLSIVHDALVCMGGTITVESDTGEGTTMRVIIPLADLPDEKEHTTCSQS